MKKIIIVISSLLLIIGAICGYCYYDVTHIYNKNLVKDKNMYITVDGYTSSISSESIRYIIENKNNKWQFTLATYAYDTYIESNNKDFNIRFTNTKAPYLIINYFNKKCGFVQIISKQPITEIWTFMNEVK